MKSRGHRVHEKLSAHADLGLYRPLKKTKVAGRELSQLEFYKHAANWSNRMILGDSLNVMASLVERETLRGNVQMVYLDPPYGIKFGSNWQPSARSRDVKDGKLQDVAREAEQIKAFRDTWALGIHSYLAYLRDRLIVARDLLTESGSCFVQIGDENVHLVRSLMDEVFGSENFVSLITYSTTAGATSEFLAGTTDYIVWYARTRSVTKFRRMFLAKEVGGLGATKYDKIDSAGRRYRHDNLTSQSQGRAKGEGAASWFPVTVGGQEFRPTMQSRWKTNEAGMHRLQLAARVERTTNTLAYVRYLDDFPAFAVTNSWPDIGGVQSRADPKIYVVQTATRAIERCMLMCTDPGDLVVDPTCGSGTTAFVAEQWGRRWITIDTSRVALALARQRHSRAAARACTQSRHRCGQVKRSGPDRESSVARPSHRGCPARLRLRTGPAHHIEVDRQQS